MDKVITEKAVYRGKGRSGSSAMTRAEVEDTYAEAFRSIYAEVLVTARDRRWLDHAVRPATGNASSTILCDCEAGPRSLRRPGRRRIARHARRPARRDRAVSRARAFARTAWRRWSGLCWCGISQNVLTCATAACFNLPDDERYSSWAASSPSLATAISSATMRYGRSVWVVPILGGEFVIDRRFGWRDGLMGGNLWFMGTRRRCGLECRRAGRGSGGGGPGVILPFPGGVAASGSKAGSRY